jgi:hypothetical protein
MGTATCFGRKQIYQAIFTYHVCIETIIYSHLFANNEPDFHPSQRIIKANTAVTIVHDSVYKNNKIL